MTNNKEEQVLKNMNLVWSIAHKLGVEHNEDAIQEGMLGLIVAVERFNPELGYQFSTYAGRYIDGYIRTFLHKNKLIPDRREGTNYKVAGCVDSLDRNIGDEGHSTLGDVIPDNTRISVEENSDWAYALSFLTEEQRKVWDLRISGMSCREIGEQINRTTTTVERILRKASIIIRRYVYGD